MHKCSKCGQDFEGEVCPNCGAADNEEKTVSPEKMKSVKKIYSFLYYLPALCLLVYAILLFALSALPVAISPRQEVLGEIIPASSCGNIYNISFNTPSIKQIVVMTELKPQCLTLFILAVCAIVYSIIAADVKAISKINDKKVGKVKLGDLLPYIGNVFYVGILVVSCVICGAVAKFDGGVGLVAVGGYPIALMVLSVLFAIGSVCGSVFYNILTAKYPQLKNINS